MFFITRTLIFFINLIILFYIYFLKKFDCECSKSKKRDFIFYFSISYIFLIINFITFPKFFRNHYILNNLLKLYLGIFMVINIYILYTYSEELDKKNCLCSDNIGRDIMKIYSVFYIFLLVLLFFIVCSNYIIHADKLKDYNNISNKKFNIPILKKV